MPMQFLIVRCSQRRSVLVDGVNHGQTGDVIELDEGTYIVTLDPATGCQPPSREVRLLNTTAIAPCEVKFELA